MAESRRNKQTCRAFPVHVGQQQVKMRRGGDGHRLWLSPIYLQW